MALWLAGLPWRPQRLVRAARSTATICTTPRGPQTSTTNGPTRVGIGMRPPPCGRPLDVGLWHRKGTAASASTSASPSRSTDDSAADGRRQVARLEDVAGGGETRSEGKKTKKKKKLLLLDFMPIMYKSYFASTQLDISLPFSRVFGHQSQGAWLPSLPFHQSRQCAVGGRRCAHDAASCLGSPAYSCRLRCSDRARPAAPNRLLLLHRACHRFCAPLPTTHV